MMQPSHTRNDVLIVIAKEQKDFYIAKTQRWYRIPTSSRIPSNLKDGIARYIAFYFPKAFGELKNSIRYYAEITNVETVSRKVLFPNEPQNSKSGRTYHKISFAELIELPVPIISHRGRQLLFVPTSWAKFSTAKEINDVFNDSPLEEKLWLELKKRNWPAERQVLLRTNEQNWICDFVFYCARGTVDVECDGDTYHMKPEAVMYDKVRNNEISAVADWDVLRFTTQHIEKDMDWILRTIGRKIDRLGGLKYVEEDTVRYVSRNDNQLDIFAQNE